MLCNEYSLHFEMHVCSNCEFVSSFTSVVFGSIFGHSKSKPPCSEDSYNFFDFLIF